MQTTYTTPLVVIAPTGTAVNHSAIATGDPVTVSLYGGKVTTGVVTRRTYGHTPATYWVKLAALAVPEGYYIGQVLPLNAAHIIDHTPQG